MKIHSFRNTNKPISMLYTYTSNMYDALFSFFSSMYTHIHQQIKKYLTCLYLPALCIVFNYLEFMDFSIVYLFAYIKNMKKIFFYISTLLIGHICLHTKNIFIFNKNILKKVLLFDSILIFNFLFFTLEKIYLI